MNLSTRKVKLIEERIKQIQLKKTRLVIRISEKNCVSMIFDIPECVVKGTRKVD